MSDFSAILNHKKAIVFSLEDVLFPKKDYYLQVYYLFAEFMAYIDQQEASAILTFLKSAYEEQGEENLFPKLAEHFKIDSKYQYNFDLLHQNARLPLKLLLFKNVLALLQEAVVNRVAIYVMVEGIPEVGINQIKQTEWHGLQSYLKLYFTAEYEHSVSQTLDEILQNQSYNPEEVLFFVAANSANLDTDVLGVPCCSIETILLD